MDPIPDCSIQVLVWLRFCTRFPLYVASSSTGCVSVSPGCCLLCWPSDLLTVNELNAFMHAHTTHVTPTQQVVHTDHILHLVLVCIWGWYFLAPHTHVLCMGSGSATGVFPAPRLVHSLLKYFFKFQLWYWIQLYTTKYCKSGNIRGTLIFAYFAQIQEARIQKPANSKTRENICNILYAHFGPARRSCVLTICVDANWLYILKSVWDLLCFCAAQLHVYM